MKFHKQPTLLIAFFAISINFLQLIAAISVASLDDSEENGMSKISGDVLAASNSPSKNTLDVKSATANDIKFLLYNTKMKGSSKWEEIADGKLIKIHADNLKKKKPFKISVHGFLATCNNTQFPLDVFKAYAKTKADYNLICVDWGPLANPVSQIGALFHYPKAVENTIIVGETMAKFIQVLLKSGYLNNTSEVHLIGHSLGSHIGGVCGHEIFIKRKEKIGRITGLDPAGPFFYEKGKEDKSKLGINDAKFVDVIQSNMGKLGANETLGHVNFIPNGGQVQPFCETNNFFENLAERISGLCSHAASTGIFAKSIGQNIDTCLCSSWEQFKNMSTKCKATNTALLGEKVSSKARGKFCLNLKTL